MNVSLALGGGGAKGNSHIGVIRYLEREGFRIRAVAGTSFGGIVAVMYAAGYSVDEIEDIFAKVDQRRLYARGGGDGPAILGLIGVRTWLDSVLGERTFHDLKIPCAVTSVDMKSGREIILSKGSLKNALLATIALPGIFPIFSMNGLDLADGGVLDPVPVSVARSLAPKLPVLAVVLSLPLGAPVRNITMPIQRIFPRFLAKRITQTRFARVFDIFLRSVDIGSRQMSELRLKAEAPDFVIRPSVEHIDLLDPVNVHEVARLGEQAVKDALPELVSLMPFSERLGRRLFGGAR
jgi:NTE family protein